MNSEERLWIKAAVADIDLSAFPGEALPASKERVLDGALDFLEFKYPGDILN